MGVRSKTIRIGEDDYIFYTLTGRKSFSVFRKLVSLFGSAFTSAAELDELQDNSEQVLSNILFTLGDDAFDDIAEDLLANVEVHGHGKLNIDDHFSGNVMAMIKLMVAVIKENYSDFFTGSGIEGIIHEIKEIFPTQETSMPSTDESKE